MPDAIESWMRGARADFQTAAHEGAKVDFKFAVHHGVSFADLPVICCQLQDMVQSIALGLNELTGALEVMNQRLDEIAKRVDARQPSPESREEEPESALCAVSAR